MLFTSLFLTAFCWLLVILQNFYNHCFVYVTKTPILSVYGRYSVFLTQFLVCTFCSCVYPLWMIFSELFAGFKVWIYSNIMTFSVIFQFVWFLFILIWNSGSVAF